MARIPVTGGNFFASYLYPTLINFYSSFSVQFPIYRLFVDQADGVVAVESIDQNTGRIIQVLASQIVSSSVLEVVDVNVCDNEITVYSPLGGHIATIETFSWMPFPPASAISFIDPPIEVGSCKQSSFPNKSNC